MTAPQLDMFTAMRRPPVRRAVERDGPVVQGDVDEHLFLAHPRMAWNRADIELHRHENGLWMWSTRYMLAIGGGGYRVGEKWGKFAESRDDALFYAGQELRESIANPRDEDVKPARLILAWLDQIGAQRTRPGSEPNRAGPLHRQMEPQPYPDSGG